MSFTPKHSPMMIHFDESPETGFNSIVIQPPTIPSYMQNCIRTCIITHGALSSTEKLCLDQCYNRSATLRPQRIILWYYGFISSIFPIPTIQHSKWQFLFWLEVTKTNKTFISTIDSHQYIWPLWWLWPI